MRDKSLKPVFKSTSLEGPSCAEIVFAPVESPLTISHMTVDQKSTTEAAASEPTPGGFQPRFHWRLLGTAAPVFPGFEIDICAKDADHKPDAVWHRDRARGMLSAHPELRRLFGHTPFTAIWCVTFTAMQIGIALIAASQPWWVVVLCAYLLGSWINICLFMLAHECNHGLVFDHRTWDRWLFTLTTLPMFLAGHHTWWVEHHVHHNELGGKKDFVKRRRSVFLLMKDNLAGFTIPERLRPLLSWSTTPLCWPVAMFMLVTQLSRSIAGLAIYFVTAVSTLRLKPSDLAVAVLADEHLVSGYDKYRIRSWAVLYPLLHLSLLAALWAIAGPKTFVYLMLSALFFTGFLHPLMFGFILSNSHFHGHNVYQPSSSYYGWLNRITFNFGLHTEHHDLEAIPWHRLGRIAEIAPEYYDNLLKTRSYVLLALKFGFGRRETFDNEEHRNARALA